MNNSTLYLTNKRIQLITWTLLLLVPIIGMAVDLIAPSLPAISSNLYSSASVVQNAVSFYLIGYGLGNFISGIFTDACGRRKLLLGGLFGFALASFIAAATSHIVVLLGVRFIQGLMLGTLSVAIRAILSDILPAEKLIALGILMGMMWGLGPIIGPVIGGYLQADFGWPAGFYFFSIIGGVGFIAAFIIIPETHVNINPLRLSILRQNFSEILANHQFIALSILMGLTYSLLITFHTAGPFLIQNVFHYSAIRFGHIALYLGILFLLATFICRYLLTKLSAKTLLLIGTNAALLIAILALTGNHFLSNNIILITVISGIMFFACGFIFPLSMGQGMSLFRHISGTATAIMYMINTLITSTMAALISLVHMHSGTPLICSYLFLTFISAVVYWKLIHWTRAA
jgi:Bcr/CflA subfamily drug resistance transporter